MTTVTEKAPAIHGVFYTDGGCKPSRGIGGWGIHGYTFYDEPAKVGSGCKDAVPTKEGYVPKNKEVDAGKPDITVDRYIDGVGSLIPESTNNIAELTALIKTYKTIESLGLKNVLILMDSEYVKENLLLPKRLETWKNNGWVRQDGAPVSNIEQWQIIAIEKERLEKDGVVIRYQWVKGHSGNLGNEMADAWASKGITAGRNGLVVDSISITDGKGYWNTKLDRNRMFSLPQWYFNTHRHPDTWKTADGFYAYHLGNLREEDELLGKPISDASFAVLYLKQPDTVLEQIRHIQESIDLAKYGSIVLGQLTEIFKLETYEEIQGHKDRFVVKDYHKARLHTTEGNLLTKEMRPARLAFNVVDALADLEKVMGEYFYPGPGSRIVGTDITTLLYETIDSKKKTSTKLKSSVSSALKSLKVDAKYMDRKGAVIETPVVLTMSLDLPDRNTLSALAELNPKVTVVTWPESDHAIRYAIVIEAGEDRGIWASIYSNLHLLTPNHQTKAAKK